MTTATPQITDYLVESEARSAWHRLNDELGFEERHRRCSIEVIRKPNASPVIRITVNV